MIKLKSLIDESMFPKEFNRHTHGSCMSAAELATKYFLSKNRSDFKVIEGWVAPEWDDDWEITKSNKTFGNVFTHTWIKFNNGRIFDPTRKQWKELGYDPDEMKIVKIKTEYSPEEYIDLCEWDPSPWQNFKKQKM